MKRHSPDDTSQIPAKLKFKRRKLEEFQRLQEKAIESPAQELPNVVNHAHTTVKYENYVPTTKPITTTQSLSTTRETSSVKEMKFSEGNGCEMRSDVLKFKTDISTKNTSNSNHKPSPPSVSQTNNNLKFPIPVDMKQTTIPRDMLQRYNGFAYFCLDPTGSHITLPNVQNKALLLRREVSNSGTLFCFLCRYKNNYYIIISNENTILSTFRMNPEKGIFEQLNIIVMMMEEEDEQMDVLKVLGLFSLHCLNDQKENSKGISDFLLVYDSQLCGSAELYSDNLSENEKLILQSEISSCFQLTNASECKLVQEFALMSLSEFQIERCITIQFLQELQPGIPSELMRKPMFLSEQEKDEHGLNFYKSLTPSQKYVTILQYSHGDTSQCQYPIFSLKHLDQAYADVIHRYKATFTEDNSQREVAWQQIRNLTTYQIHYCRQLRIAGDLLNSLLVLYYLVVLFAFGREWMLPFDQRQEQLLIQSVREFVSGYTFSIIQYANEEISTWWTIAMQELSTIPNSLVETTTAACAIKHGWRNEVLERVMNGHRPSFAIWKNMEPVTCGLMRIDMLLHQNEYMQSYFIASSIDESVKWFQLMINKSRSHTATLIVLEHELNPITLFQMAKMIHKPNSQALFIACNALEKACIYWMSNPDQEGKDLLTTISQWLTGNYLVADSGVDSVRYSSFSQSIAQYLNPERYNITDIDVRPKLHEMYDKCRHLTDIYRPLTIGFLLKYSPSESLIQTADQCFRAGKKWDAFDILLWIYHVDSGSFAEKDTDRLLNLASEFDKVSKVLEPSSQALDMELYPDHPVKFGTHIPMNAPIPFKWTKIIYQKDILIAYSLGMISLQHSTTRLHQNLDLIWFLQNICNVISKAHFNDAIYNIETLRIRLHPNVLLELSSYLTQILSTEQCLHFLTNYIQNSLAADGPNIFAEQKDIFYELLLIADKISMQHFVNSVNQNLIPPFEVEYLQTNAPVMDSIETNEQKENLVSPIENVSEEKSIPDQTKVESDTTTINTTTNSIPTSHDELDLQIEVEKPNKQNDIVKYKEVESLSQLTLELMKYYRQEGRFDHAFIIAHNWLIQILNTPHVHVEQKPLRKQLYSTALEVCQKVSPNLTPLLDINSMKENVEKLAVLLEAVDSSPTDEDKAVFVNELSRIREQLFGKD